MKKLLILLVLGLCSFSLYAVDLGDINHIRDFAESLDQDVTGDGPVNGALEREAMDDENLNAFEFKPSEAVLKAVKILMQLSESEVQPTLSFPDVVSQVVQKIKDEHLDDGDIEEMYGPIYRTGPGPGHIGLSRSIQCMAQGADYARGTGTGTCQQQAAYFAMMSCRSYSSMPHTCVVMGCNYL